MAGELTFIPLISASGSALGLCSKGDRLGTMRLAVHLNVGTMDTGSRDYAFCSEYPPSECRLESSCSSATAG